MLSSLGRTRAILAIIAAVLLTSGCGAGAGAALELLAGGVGSGGTGIGIVKGIGVITGFGSLIVDGVRHDDSVTNYMSEEDQGAPMAMAPTGAMLGQRLEYAYDPSGAMSSALMSPELVGTVTSASASGLTVLGTNVTINGDTTLGPVTGLVGYASPTAIQIGDRVAIYGLLKTDAQGTASVQATLIVQKSTGAGTRLTDYVSQFNATTGRFSIGSNTINAGSAVISPAGASLSNGQLVTVWSDTAPIGNVIAARNIRIKWPPTETSDRILSGPIAAYAGMANFKLLGVTIDASAATITPTGAALGDGKYVVAGGKYDTAAKKLIATTVTVYVPAAGGAVELHGTILNFVSSSSFTVRGAVVDASTARFSGGAAKDLANNVFVQVTGAVSNNIVRASTVTILALNPMQAPVGAMLDFSGTIASYDASTGRYVMTLSSGATVSGMMGSSMFYNNGAATDFSAGQSVNIRGTINGGVLSTSVVSFTQAAGTSGAGATPATGAQSGPTYMEGIAYSVTPTSFMLNGVTIQRNGVAIMGGGMMGNHMASGMRIGVTVQNTGGQYSATAIKVLNG